MLAARLVGKGSVVGNYHSSLVYDDFSSGGSRFRTYSESMMKVMRDTFLKWINGLLETVPDWGTVRYPVWLLPAPFCTTRYVTAGTCQGMTRQRVKTCEGNGKTMLSSFRQILRPARYLSDLISY